VPIAALDGGGVVLRGDSGALHLVDGEGTVIEGGTLPVGNPQYWDAGTWAGEGSVEFVTGPTITPAWHEFVAGAGNRQWQNALAAAVPYVVQVVFQSGYCGSSDEWRVGPCPGDAVLSSTEQAIVRSEALQAMRDAFRGYDVTFSTPDLGAPRQVSVKEKLHPKVPPGEIAIGFSPGDLTSEVYFPNVWSTLESIVGCPPLNNVCLQTKQLSRADVLRAFGRGIGNTAAHELGHQPPYFFTADVVPSVCAVCYDSARGNSRAHFFGGPLGWSPWAKRKMRFLESKK
jgi:hypothetical protein